ncbi:hypothetical protein R1T40_11700 [Tritonibacter scottomollicae]|uniref:Glycosyltransferase RgtA/B/C/D-like domain-containing protein n=1 Tax=Tritonibacter scottomollicae TaxID=483013 RepID=A0ABZ0HA21_TRISK|nr:hypothetical protein [Tritonibacter scottomollicae]WOI31630.1 hypothetical protein R1T40_11700 [Tritonibacter scottomollicae]
MATNPNSSSLGQKHWVPILALSLIYAVIYGPSVFARIVASEFMEIDPRSIMTSLDGLTTGPTYYNMNKQYHSQFYGWTYFSLNFFLIMIAKLFAVTSEMSINLIVRGSLFIIGLGLVAQTYHLVQKFFARIWAFALTIVVIVNPVSAHYFITIHPESLGVLLQLIAVGILISLYQNLPKFSKKKFFLAVLFLSLSSLSKQPFFITGTFVYIGFLIIALTTAEKPVALAGWWPICKVTLQSIGVFLLVLLFIHPYALVQMNEFLATQSSLSGEHAGKSFPEVWPRWRAQLLANFLPLINIALLPFILLLRQVPLALKVTAVFTMLAVVIFILNARLFVNINYLYPVYFFLSFNAFYFVFKVVVPRVRHTAGHAVGAGLQGVCVALIAVVSLSNFAHAVTKTHQRFLLDGLTTQHVTWSYLEQFETGTRVVFSPNVAVLAPLIATSCNAWSGCGDQVGIADYDPDIVVFSPEYPHFEAAEFETFVSQSTYELRKTVEAQDWPELSACTATPAGIQAGETIGIGLVVAHYLSNPLRCKTAYVASLQAYADQAIVLGYDTRIYVKGQ